MTKYGVGNIQRCYHVNCGICRTLQHGYNSQQSYFERQLRELGWIKTKAHSWICPKCKEVKDAQA